MAEIKFTTERMRQVHDRLDQMIAQLRETVMASNESLNNISSNIDSDRIKATIKGYVVTVAEKSDETIKNLGLLDEYLVSKILAYTSINQSGSESLTSVENMLNQISG